MRILLVIFMIPILGISGFLYIRYSQNRTSVVPYPYIVEKYKELPEDDAPILIVGDRLGHHLTLFKKLLQDKLSENLSKPIEINSMATKGEGLHRTLAKMKQLKKLPLIIIYLGGSEEFRESRFLTKDIVKISQNFNFYRNDTIRTILMLFPELSRLLYHPVKYKRFGNEIKDENLEFDDLSFQKRSQINITLFSQELNDFFSYTKEHSSFLMALTAPINIDIKPKKVCDGSIDSLGEDKKSQVLQLMKAKDFKAAYNISKELTQIANANAGVHYLHGTISKNLGLYAEARNSLETASAYDCKSWRASALTNAIIKKNAKKNGILLFDFHSMLMADWGKNILFKDEIYPQNLYMEKAVTMISYRIKKLLKL